jgi:hypothetical protein
MSLIWLDSENCGWVIYPLRNDRHALSPNPRDPIRLLPAARPEKTAAFVGCYSNPAGGEIWILECPASVRVRINGDPVYLGVHTLKDRDEIVLAGKSRFYFSLEELAHVEPFPGAAQPVFCARCKKPIEKGTLAVRCPSSTCRQWSHQAEKMPCWTYGPTCPMCDQPSKLDPAEYRWTPEVL